MHPDTMTWTDDAPEVETPLEGGDVSDGLVRRGATVRRPRGEHSAAVEAYLLHLERAGFDGAPRFLGIDDVGREVCTFVEGDMGGRPVHPWALGEHVLVELAELQRRLHDVSAHVVLPPGVTWRERVRIDEVPDVFDAPDVVGHNDITVENTIFSPAGEDGQRHVRGVIDFDLAGPSTRILDVATTLSYWGPVRAPSERDAGMVDLDVARRIRVFTDAYGLDRSERLELLDVTARRFARSWYSMRHAAQTRGGGWQRMWDDGVGDVIRRNDAWFTEQRDALARLLR
ncbi:aminoglycoside phosphotransferase [Beutenbergia cavernae DSM 12333]|uniref:Aminoglycoside phosphotransferase n=1 Tax=Beutenbergia cavernae (strain ATCC BAA-8 / DSM 12333 / CCUG 43141 / JCM 11478 / NBRC 16432 / NCIMB 13614 / HKI 0122) TaxID=471853 RepID=C5BYB7_BEUC1|nr:phosphotransferase [Beutenbergia cavernae]ACQ81017.1 aminoglycoside phosphotransferase [Beutenbergia cavernae DSM 12333]